MNADVLFVCWKCLVISEEQRIRDTKLSKKVGKKEKEINIEQESEYKIKGN